MYVVGVSGSFKSTNLSMRPLVSRPPLPTQGGAQTFYKCSLYTATATATAAAITAIIVENQNRLLIPFCPLSVRRMVHSSQSNCRPPPGAHGSVPFTRIISSRSRSVWLRAFW